MAKSLKVITLNVNGLLNHEQELQAVQDINKMDVCLVSETHFTKQSYPKFTKPSNLRDTYSVFHTIHPARQEEVRQ